MTPSIPPAGARSPTSLAAALAALGGTLLLAAGCTTGPGSAQVASTDPLVVTADGIDGGAAAPERAGAVAAIRAEAVAVNATPPAETAAEQSVRLAARAEPRTLAEVQAIEAELALIAERRAGAAPGDVAALEARAAELRRLAAAAQTGGMRQQN
jgi:hypothetical protein